MSKDRWTVPEIGWLPLRRAVFEFHATAGGKSPRLSAASIEELTQVLESKSGAEAVISLTAPSFSFGYSKDGLWGRYGPPWEILGEEEADPAGFHTVIGISGSDAESAGRNTRRYEAVKEATAFVWRELMLPAFAQAVSLEAVQLYGRPNSPSADFERLSPDIWPLLDVVEWRNGKVIFSDGSAYSSVHASIIDIPVPGPKLRSPTQPLRRRPPGPKPRKRESIEKAMKSDIRQGRLTLTDLATMLEKNLAEDYDASRDTVRKARDNVLLELGYSDSDK